MVFVDTAFIASRGGWLYCDDSRITTADPKDVVVSVIHLLALRCRLTLPSGSSGLHLILQEDENLSLVSDFRIFLLVPLCSYSSLFSSFFQTVYILITPTTSMDFIPSFYNSSFFFSTHLSHYILYLTMVIALLLSPCCTINLLFLVLQFPPDHTLFEECLFPSVGIPSSNPINSNICNCVLLFPIQHSACNLINTNNPQL